MSLKIGVIYTPPYATNCSLNDTCLKRGFAIDAARIACKILQLNCSFIWYPKSDYGDVDANGNGSGLIGAIQRGEFDATLPILTPTFKRFQAVAFSHTLFYLNVILATRAPNGNSDKLNWSLLYAFQWPIYVAFVFSLILLSLLMMVAGSKIRRTSILNQKPNPLLTSFFDNCASLIDKKYKNSLLNFDGIRLSVGVWSLVGVVLGGAYTGTLFSQKVSLNANSPFVDLETFAGCLEKKSCRLVLSSTSVSSYLQLTAHGSDLSNRINQALLHNPVVIMQREKIPEAILTETRFFLVWLATEEGLLYNVESDKICLYHIADTPLKEECAFAVRKNFPIVDQLSMTALHFRENALATALRKKYVRDRTACDDRGESRSWVDQGRGLYSVRTIFYIFLLGILSGLIALSIETAIAFCLKK